MNKLIKINEKHYIIYDDFEIKDVRPYKGKFHYEKGVAINKFPTYLTDLSECKLITHSFGKQLKGVINRPLNEVQEVIDGYNVEKMAVKYASDFIEDEHLIELQTAAYLEGFEAYKEIVKDKFVITKDEVSKIIEMARTLIEGNNEFEVENILGSSDGTYGIRQKYCEEEIIQSLMPKNEWNVGITTENKILCQN